MRCVCALTLKMTDAHVNMNNNYLFSWFTRRQKAADNVFSTLSVSDNFYRYSGIRLKPVCHVVGGLCVLQCTLLMAMRSR